MLAFALRMFCCQLPKTQMGAWGCLFRPWRFLRQQNHIGFDIKGLQINHQALHGTTTYDILRTVRLTVLFLRRTSILCLSCKHLLLLYDYIKYYYPEDLKHLQMNDKNCEHFLRILFLDFFFFFWYFKYDF